MNHFYSLAELISTDTSPIKTMEEYFQNGKNVTDFAVSAFLLLTLSAFISFQIRRACVYIVFFICDILFLFASILGLPMLRLTSIIIFVGSAIIFLFVNSGVLRQYIAKPLKAGKNQVNEKKKAAFDKEKLIQSVVTAVNWLSTNKVGALITFERDTPLDDFIKSGTVINCPFTPEIVETIFYEGTRLHDGAIIIKEDTIVAAAVYYPPSTKAIVGKFGARHRAALGISEITDAITIVVSEETGRITIAHAGIMDNVKTDEFEKIFRTQIM